MVTIIERVPMPAPCLGKFHKAYRYVYTMFGYCGGRQWHAEQNRARYLSRAWPTRVLVLKYGMTFAYLVTFSQVFSQTDFCVSVWELTTIQSCFLRKFKKPKPQSNPPPNFWIIFISLCQEVKKKMSYSHFCTRKGTYLNKYVVCQY